MTDHASIRERLLDLAYGELSRREARAVERHLEACEACRAELARIRETRAALSSLAPEPAPEAGLRSLLAAAGLAAERARARRRGRLLPRWVWAGSIGVAAAAAVVLITVGLPPALRERLDDPGALLGRAPPAPVAPAETVAEPASRPGAVSPGPRSAEEGSARPAVRPGSERARAEARRAPPAAGRAAPGPAPATPPAAPPPAAVAAREEAEGSSRPARKVARAAPAPLDEEAFAQAPEAEASAGVARVAPDPVETWERLQASGGLVRTVRRFEGCPEEQVREIDRDAAGRVVRLATLRASAGWLEQFYARDGSLAAVRLGPGDSRRTVVLEGGAPPPGLPGLVLRAEDVSAEAAPRCR